MVYSLTYRRPKHVDRDSCTSSDEQGKASMHSSITGIHNGIPDALSFDRIIDGGTCPPCTVKEFLNYLRFIERAPENLQFFLWLRSYKQRFQEVNISDIALSPEWTKAMQEDALHHARAMTKYPRHLVPASATTIFNGTDFQAGNRGIVITEHDANPFRNPSVGCEKSPAALFDSDSKKNPFNSQDTSINTRSAESYQTSASDAFSTLGLNQPFTIQPFREEVNRVIATYIIQDSPRELNTSGPERYALLKALQYTTHPTAFATIGRTTESSLRRQAHPNFIRWTICNGNRPRVIFARCLGLCLILMGIILALFFTLSTAHRGWRALAAILWLIGLATIIAAWKGMCVVLHGLHHRHLRPWELFEDSEEMASQASSSSNLNHDLDHAYSKAHKSYEEEPWVIKYQKRNLIRKILDKEVWIQEPALRQIQDTIFLQGVVGGLVGAAVLTGIFVAMPAGEFY